MASLGVCGRTGTHLFLRTRPVWDKKTSHGWTDILHVEWTEILILVIVSAIVEHDIKVIIESIDTNI